MLAFPEGPATLGAVLTHSFATRRDCRSSRSDVTMVAVGFNPRTMSLKPWVRRVATIEIMANTCTSLRYHIVFSTKNRERWIRMGVEERI